MAEPGGFSYLFFNLKTSMRVERRRAAFKISLEKLVVGLSAANSSASVGGRIGGRKPESDN